MEGNLSLQVIRGAESWQFFAFVFAALLVLFYGLIDELSVRWVRILLKIGSFVIVGYFTLLSPWGRNLLVALLTSFKQESH